jgi:hypothetical protein
LIIIYPLFIAEKTIRFISWLSHISMVKIGVFLWKAIDHPPFFPLKTPSFHASTGGDLADVFHIASARFFGGKNPST